MSVCVCVCVCVCEWAVRGIDDKVGHLYRTEPISSLAGTLRVVCSEG